MVEFKIQPKDLALFKQVLDDHLRKLNSDYDAKRNGDITLSLLKLNVASPGLFYRWMKDKNKLEVSTKCIIFQMNAVLWKNFLNRAELV